MAEIRWHEAINKVEPCIFRIFTPGGSGSGYLISASETTGIVAIATALHVIEHANIWDEPIRVQHYQSGKIFLLKPEERAIHIDTNQDTAVIIFEVSEFDIPNQIPNLFEPEKILKRGVEVGWLGFPAVSAGALCFFSGRVSAQIENETAYLVDGVAINGVSGGPALWLGYDDFNYIGVVSAYIPNRSTGEVLPGLSVIQDVSQFHDITNRIRSIDEAKRNEEIIVPEETESEAGIPDDSK
ncbi:MAG: serine protease [Candidatus Thiodiazotropha endolucinida]